MCPSRRERGTTEHVCVGGDHGRKEEGKHVFLAVILTEWHSARAKAIILASGVIPICFFGEFYPVLTRHANIDRVSS